MVLKILVHSNCFASLPPLEDMHLPPRVLLYLAQFWRDMQNSDFTVRNLKVLHYLTKL